MSTFIYEAYDQNGVLMHGEFEAAAKEEVLTHLLKRSLTPVSIVELTGGGLKHRLALFERISTGDTLFLVRNLAIGLKSGLPVLEALEMLRGDSSKASIDRMFLGVIAAVKNGLPLSKSFEPYRRYFPVAFIGMLRAGEISGELDRMLAALAQYLQKEFTLRSRVRSALIYPMILLVASSGVVILLLTVVLPKLSNSFATSGVQLPLITRFFLSLSNALTYSFILDAVIVVFLVIGGFMLARTQSGKLFAARVFMHTPVLAHVMRKIALVRFARTLGNLLQSGITMLESLAITADAIGNARYSAVLRDAQSQVESGTALSSALAQHPDLFPNILMSLMRVGEKTGTLGAILIELADFYDEELDARLHDLTAMIEPILLLVMGLLVGAIALSILLPIYQLVGNFS